MNENEAFAALAGMGIVALVVMVALALAVSIFYYLTLQQAMNAVSPANRPLPGGLIWLALVPVAGLIWYMIYIVLLASALRTELAQRGETGDGGLAVSVALVALLVLCFVPYVNLLAILPAVALWLTHWTKTANCRRLLEGGQPALAV
ncbi:hypothetical protein [Chromobacterium sp. CV08]|uniref:hypothetical protein n=1 Tax=Chromobacterium sp. CV08 TaxID=3133274 RepID=UPI003DA90624